MTLNGVIAFIWRYFTEFDSFAWLGRQRQVWFIPLADVRGVCR